MVFRHNGIILSSLLRRETLCVGALDARERENVGMQKISKLIKDKVLISFFMFTIKLVL